MQDFAVDATSVYFTNGVYVLELPLGGAEFPARVFEEPADDPNGIAVDATSVYWTAGDRVMRIDKQP